MQIAYQLFEWMDLESISLICTWNCFRKIYIYFTCFVSTYSLCHEGIGLGGIRVMCECQPLCAKWNLGPLQKQQVLLTKDESAHPLHIIYHSLLHYCNSSSIYNIGAVHMCHFPPFFIYSLFTHTFISTYNCHLPGTQQLFLHV